MTSVLIENAPAEDDEDRWRPTSESVERQLTIHSWPEALYRAYHYDTRKLSAYLRRRTELDLPLDQDQLDQVADLMDRRIHHGTTPGRKPGRIPAPKDKIVDDVVCLARGELRRIRQRKGGQAPRGSHRAAILRAWQHLTDGCINIDMQAALTKLRHF
jgi:hypothetical protein